MRIAMFSPSLPRPFGSADARWLFVCMNEIGRRGHELELISCTESSETEIQDAQRLAQLAGCRLHHVPMHVAEPAFRRRLRSLRNPHSEYARVAGLPELLDTIAQRADVVHVEHLFPSWLALNRRDTSVYLHHLEAIDWTGPRTLTRHEQLEKLQIGRATRHLLRRLPNIIAATPRIAHAAREINPTASVEVASVAIDTTLYPMLEMVQEPVVGVVGSMHWYPSRSAAERVLLRLWPRIREQVPNARLIVAGFGAEQYLGKHFPCEGAELLGTVDRPEDFFEQASVLLYPPERGSGMKIKALESFAYGVPVVSNTEGFEGLDGESGTHYVHAESDEALIAATVDLLKTPALRESLRENARAFVDEHYSPRPAVDRLFAAWQRQHGLAAIHNIAHIGSATAATQTQGNAA